MIIMIEKLAYLLHLLDSDNLFKMTIYLAICQLIIIILIDLIKSYKN